LLLSQAKRGQGNLAFLAFMTDRILCNKGLHQRFGTQIRETDNGSFVPKCMENTEAIDMLRQQVALEESLADYLQRINEGDVVLYRRILHGYVERLEQQKENKILEFPHKK